MAKYRELSINSSIFALFVIAHQALSSPSTLHINLTWEYRVGFVLIVFSSLSMLEEMSLYPSATERPKHSGCERIFAKVYFFIPAVEVLEPQADNKRRR